MDKDFTVRWHDGDAEYEPRFAFFVLGIMTMLASIGFTMAAAYAAYSPPLPPGVQINPAYSGLIGPQERSDMIYRYCYNRTPCDPTEIVDSINRTNMQQLQYIGEHSSQIQQVPPFSTTPSPATQAHSP